MAARKGLARQLRGEQLTRRLRRKGLAQRLRGEQLTGGCAAKGDSAAAPQRADWAAEPQRTTGRPIAGTGRARRHRAATVLIVDDGVRLGRSGIGVFGIGALGIEALRIEALRVGALRVRTYGIATLRVGALDDPISGRRPSGNRPRGIRPAVSRSRVHRRSATDDRELVRLVRLIRCTERPRMSGACLPSLCTVDMGDTSSLNPKAGRSARFDPIEQARVVDRSGVG